MVKLTKYASFDALKKAESVIINPVTSGQALDAEVQQAAVMLNKLRAKRQWENARE